MLLTDCCGIPPCIPDSYLYRVTNTRCRIGTAFSPDDGHVVARNVYRKAINTLRKFVHQVDSIYKILYNDAGQQNIKKKTNS
jgi:Fe2+ or Zn2+ uptake regulation protein